MNEEQTYPATRHAQQSIPPSSERLRPPNDLVEYCRKYSRERPEVVALWCFGIGFMLGWKLKPW